MSTSVGQVNLNLGINQNSVKSSVSKAASTAGQQMAKSTGPFKKLFGTMSVAVGNIFANMFTSAIKSMGSFISSSIDLGSSIAELENVTSTVFPNMTAEIESFSKSALETYGMTELQTKKMMGTFGAMAGSFGYAEKASYDMAASITGLVGDVASFYNLDHDVAYTKMKSVFTGETESLKELGIVMTQTALDEFAMQKGMGKTVDKMSEQEKVALRLAFVTDKLSFAQGDFAKTQMQWANQTRILSGQWDTFKSSLGQVMIQVLTPLIQKLNEVMKAVNSVTDKFREFIMTLSGKDAASGAGSLIKEVAGVTTAAGDTAEAASGQATKAAKEVKKSLLGFDKLNKLSNDSSSSGSSGSSSKITDMSHLSTNLPTAETENATSALDGFKRKFEEVMSSIASWTGLDTFWSKLKTTILGIDFSPIKNNFTSIFNSLKPIAQAAFDGIGEVLRSYMSLMGTYASGLITTTVSAIEHSTGVIAKNLETYGGAFVDTISTTATNISTIFSGLEPIVSAMFSGLSEVTNSFLGYVITNATGIMLVGSKAIELATGGVSKWLGEQGPIISSWITTTAGKLATGFDNLSFSSEKIFGLLWKALDDNKEVIEGAISNVLSAFSTMGMTIGTIFADMWLGLTEGIKNFVTTNETKLSTFFNGLIGTGTLFANTFSGIISDIFTSLNSWWENDGKRIWSEIVSVFFDLVGWVISLWNNTIKPIVDALIIEVQKLWKEHLKPLWDNILGFLTSVWDFIMALWTNVLKPVISWIVEHIGPIIAGVVQGLIKVIGSFVGWIVDIVSSIIKTIKGIIDFITGVFTGDWQKAWDGIKGILSAIWGSIRDTIKAIVGVIKGIVSALWSGISGGAKAVWAAVSGIFKGVANWFNKNLIQPVAKFFKGLWDGFLSGAKSAWSGIKSVFSSVATFFSNIFKNAWDGVKKVFSVGGKIFDGIKDGIITAFKAVVNAIITGINKVVSLPFNGLNTILNTISGLSILGLKPFSWLTWRAPVPQIPMLAEGGYIGANQPTLAMIGDNKRHGEIVAPEDKLYDVVSKALQAFMGQLVAALNAGSASKQSAETLQLIVQLGEETIVNRIIKMINAESRRQGTSVIRV